MNIDDLVERDLQLRERLTFFKEQQQKYGNCRRVLEDLERTYCEYVISKYDAKEHTTQLGDALTWFGQYHGWTK